MTIKMYKSYGRSRSTALLAVILLSSFACSGLKAAANSGLGEQLRAAAKAGDLDVVQCLVEHGADVDALTADDIHPVSLARDRQQDEIADWLLQHGAREPSLIRRMYLQDVCTPLVGITSVLALVLALVIVQMPTYMG